MTDVSVSELLEVAAAAASVGGRILLDHRYTPLKIEHKARQEVVTNVDKLADQAICELIRRYFPAHAMVSEESGVQQTASPYTWIIDPLDGTESYIRGQNFAGVTVAVAKAGRLLAGVVYHPFHDELYAATVDHATTVNGHTVHVTEVRDLKQARLILDYSPRDDLRRHFHALEWDRGFKQAFRIGGSVALNMCLVAKGAVEGYLYSRLRNRVKSWDIAAAALIVQGAGGRVLDRHGQPPDTLQPQGFLLCCNASLDLRTLFNGALSVPDGPDSPIALDC